MPGSTPTCATALRGSSAASREPVRGLRVAVFAAGAGLSHGYPNDERWRRRGDLDRAVAEFKQAIRLKPMLDRASYGLGVSISAAASSGTAIEHRQEAAKQQYFNPHAGYELAIAYHRAGQQDKAVAEQKRVEGHDPKIDAQIAHDIGLR